MRTAPTARRPGRSTPVIGRIRPPEPSTRRSTRARRSPRMVSAAFAAASSTPVRATRPASALEAGLAAVEGATFGRAFSSGMAATDCTLRAVLRPGDHVVIPDDAYGGTFRLIDKVFTQWGVTHTPVALSDLDAVRAAITPTTRLVWVETPTNPLLTIADIAGIAQLASASGVKVVGRQHLCLAGPATAAGAGRRHRPALHDQVHRRPLRRRRRRAGHRRRGTRRRVRASCRTARAPCPARSTPT